MGVLAHDPGDQGNLVEVEFVGDPVHRKRADRRVRHRNLFVARGGGIPIEGGGDIGGNRLPQPDQGGHKFGRDGLGATRRGHIHFAQQGVKLLGHHRNFRTQLRAVELKTQQPLGAVHPIHHFLGIHDAPADRLGERILAASRESANRLLDELRRAALAAGGSTR